MADIPELTPEEAAALGIPAITAEDAKALGVPETASPVKTAVLSGAQGATAGLVDEATGAVAGALASGPGRWLREKTGILPLNPDGSDPLAPTGGGAAEAYSGARDTLRQETDRAAKDNPKTAFVSELTTSVASPINKLAPTMGAGKVFSPAMRQAAVGGAIQGGISGAGYSEADDLVGVGRDVAVSSLFGGAMGLGVAGGAEAIRTGVNKVRAIAARPPAAPNMTPVAPQPALAASDGAPAITAATAMETGTAPASQFAPRTAVDPVLPASQIPDGATAFERMPAKTEIGAHVDPEAWADFLKGRIGPAMSRNKNNVAAAMKELGKEWKNLVKKREGAKTVFETDTILDGPPAAVAERAEALTRVDPMARTAPGKAIPTQIDLDPNAKTIQDFTAPPRRPKSPDSPSAMIEKEEAARIKAAASRPRPVTDDQILDQKFREKLVKDKEELAKQIQAEITEGPAGLKTTPTKQKHLDKASDAIVAEVTTGPDAKAVRQAYTGPAKQGRSKLAKIIDQVDAKNDAHYEQFARAGRDTVDHVSYVEGLRKAASAANKAGRTKDVALLDYMADAFEKMRTRDGGQTVTLPQLRGWTTEVQEQAASAIGGLNPHAAAQLKARAASLITAEMYNAVAKAASGDKALMKAADEIGRNNRRLHGLLTIDEALSARQWKEQGDKPFTQRAVEAVATGAMGAAAGAGAGYSSDNSFEGAIGLGGAAAIFGSRGQVAAALGRKAQRQVTGNAIKAVQKLSKGRDQVATEQITDGALRVGSGLTSAARQAHGKAPEDLSVLTNEELAREIAIASGDRLNGARYTRAVKELQSRRRQ